MEILFLPLGAINHPSLHPSIQIHPFHPIWINDDDDDDDIRNDPSDQRNVNRRHRSGNGGISRKSMAAAINDSDHGMAHSCISHFPPLSSLLISSLPPLYLSLMIESWASHLWLGFGWRGSLLCSPYLFPSSGLPVCLPTCLYAHLLGVGDRDGDGGWAVCRKHCMTDRRRRRKAGE